MKETVFPFKETAFLQINMDDLEKTKESLGKRKEIAKTNLFSLFVY